jgi:hypothetical protein
VKLEASAARLWKRAPLEERRAAAAAFWKQPSEDLIGTAFGAIARSRRMRPQVVRTLDEETRVRALAAILDPGEPLAAGLLVALHVADRRPLLTAFLDGAGLAHEDGILPEEGETRTISVDQARKGLAALTQFPPEQAALYLNTLWLQDPERWSALEELEEPG